MGHTYKGIDRAHPYWLICPTVLLFSIAGAVGGHSQAPEQVALATEVPDNFYSHQPAHIEPPPATPEEVGDALMLHHRYQAAIESYRKATPSSDVWDKIGIAYEMMFSSTTAEHCYKESLKLNPRNAHTLNNYGSLHFSQKQFSAAERMYRKALEIEPGSAAVQLNLGTDLIAEHKFEEGWEHYRAALEIDTHAFENTISPRIGNPALVQDRGAVNYYLARGFARAGLMKTAIDHLRAALEQGFTNPGKIESDQSFAALRELPAYQDLLSQTRHP